ncbi:HAMP domain-containing histidine kinase [Parabacteroides sp. OttesenSCG-928-G07]|nr:HAMP domain-containing histidine kinase [Parabacteroides sp. OttesenSCG-928-G07]
MKTEQKISRRQTLVAIGIIALVAIVCFVFAFFYTKSYLSPEDGVLIRWLVGFLLAGIVCVSAVVFYLLERKYTDRIIQKIETTSHTEKTFISNASHELNNPLTAIQGECEITLMKERTPKEYQIALSRIASETRRIIQLMKHLLFLSHGENEILNQVIEPISLAEFLMQFAQNRTSFSPDNFSFVVKANPNLLKIAIENILNNALKYSEYKPVEMRLSGNVLYIKDYGIGIPASDLEHIAQPFFRASNTHPYKGHGIGLSLSIQILNTYGAKVTITSAVNEGTDFKIEFP